MWVISINNNYHIKQTKYVFLFNEDYQNIHHIYGNQKFITTDREVLLVFSVLIHVN